MLIVAIATLIRRICLEVAIFIGFCTLTGIILAAIVCIRDRIRRSKKWMKSECSST